MRDVKDSNDSIVNELKKINERLAAFIAISVLFYLGVLVLIFNIFILLHY